MKLIALTLIAFAAAAFAADSVAVEDWQRKAVAKYPSLAVEGSDLNRKFVELVKFHRAVNPGFFNEDDWPMRAAELANDRLREAAESRHRAETAKQRAREREAKAAADEKEMLAQWESEKPRRVFDKLVFGDSEEMVRRKLDVSDMVKPTVYRGGSLGISYEWPIGELVCRLAFKVDGGLSEISAWARARNASYLDTLVMRDWETLRAVAIERYGPPTKSAPYPSIFGVKNGFGIVTDRWELPDRTIAVQLVEENSTFYPLLEISDPARAATARASAEEKRTQAVKAAASALGGK